MANEVLHSDLGLASVAAQELLLAVKDRSILGNHPALFYGGDLMGSKSSTVTIPVVGAMGYDAPAAGSENSAASNVAFVDNSATVAVARRVVTKAVSGLALNLGSEHGIFSDAQLLAQEALMLREVALRSLIANLVDGFTSSVGSTGVDLTADVLLQARGQLEANEVEGPYLCILHPQQLSDLRIDLKDTMGLMYGENNRQLIDVARGLGYQGTFQGIDIFTTTDVPTANAGADRAGGMFGYGCIAWADSSIVSLPFGDQSLNLGKAKVQIESTGASDMHQVTFTSYIGASIAQDKGVTIVSDA